MLRDPAASSSTTGLVTPFLPSFQDIRNSPGRSKAKCGHFAPLEHVNCQVPSHALSPALYATVLQYRRGDLVLGYAALTAAGRKSVDGRAACGESRGRAPDGGLYRRSEAASPQRRPHIILSAVPVPRRPFPHIAISPLGPPLLIVTFSRYFDSVAPMLTSTVRCANA